MTEKRANLGKLVLLSKGELKTKCKDLLLRISILEKRLDEYETRRMENIAVTRQKALERYRKEYERTRLNEISTDQTTTSERVIPRGEACDELDL